MQNPELYGKGLLADYVIQHRLFSWWLPEMCTPNTSSQALYHRVTAPAYASGRFLSIMGYFPSQEVSACCTCPGTLAAACRAQAAAHTLGIMGAARPDQQADSFS